MVAPHVARILVLCIRISNSDLVAISLLGGLLVCEWSCGSDGGAGSYKACDFWTKQSPYNKPLPN